MGYQTSFRKIIPLYMVGCIRVTHPCAGRHHLVLLPNMLPLDLHVLSLPLAFILSQDQTLHCKLSSLYLLLCLLFHPSLNVFQTFATFGFLCFNELIPYLNVFPSSSLHIPFVSIGSAKVQHFFFLPNIFSSFLKKNVTLMTLFPNFLYL